MQLMKPQANEQTQSLVDSIFADVKFDWYILNEDVEYSTKFNIFYEYQIALTQQGQYYRFTSRLERKEFRMIRIKAEHDTESLKNICKEIHQEILSGKHGIGTLIN